VPLFSCNICAYAIDIAARSVGLEDLHPIRFVREYESEGTGDRPYDVDFLDSDGHDLEHGYVADLQTSTLPGSALQAITLVTGPGNTRHGAYRVEAAGAVSAFLYLNVSGTDPTQVDVYEATANTADRCDDGNPCTDDRELEGGQCSHTANMAACWSGVLCSTGDRCEGGECQAGNNDGCVDDDPCTLDACDPAGNLGAGTCLHTADPAKPGCCATDADCVSSSSGCAPAARCSYDPIAQYSMCEGDSQIAGWCCATPTDCNDNDPCTIDRCEGIVNGEGLCRSYSYMDLTEAQIAQYGYDPVSFEDCCVQGKEQQYCADHLVIVDDLVQQDACWYAECVSNVCRYGRNPDPQCCNTSADCVDCAAHDPVTGECTAPDLCTFDACVEHQCVFEFDPLGPGAVNCCQYDLDCNDSLANTIDWCEIHACHHVPMPRYCNTAITPPATCDSFNSSNTNPCLAYECNLTTEQCDGNGISGCCLDDDGCDDGDACTTDVCDALLHTCSHQAVELFNGYKCCNVSLDCFDSNVCTNEACVAHECHYGAVTVSLTQCASGKCCSSNDDVDNDGSADDCQVAGSCTRYQCSNHCCVPKTNLATGECITYLDCEDGDSYTWNVCVGCACDQNPVTTCDETHPACNDLNACTVDSCDLILERCTYTPVPGCCLTKTDCVPVEPDPCNNYLCVSNACVELSVTDCCVGDADTKCDDLDGCTADFCVNGVCQHVPFDGNCCAATADCDDGRDCTVDQCEEGACTHMLLEMTVDGVRCCDTDGACADADPCTQDMCIDNQCSNAAIPDCCAPDGQEVPICDDGDPCTADWCVYGRCRHLAPSHAPGANIPPVCCVIDDDCDDGRDCTADVCGGRRCSHTLLDYGIVNGNKCCNEDSDCFDPVFCIHGSCINNECADTYIGDDCE